MKLKLIAMGSKMPKWVTKGFEEYIKRLPSHIRLTLHEIPLLKRTAKFNIKKIQEKEAQLMISAIDKDDYVVALDANGKHWSSEQFSKHIKTWEIERKNISMLIGGPEGMLPEVLDYADLKWSLSAMTLPHPIVRLVIVEQIYRAWSILNNHPYHK